MTVDRHEDNSPTYTNVKMLKLLALGQLGGK